MPDQELEGLEWPELTTALEIDRNDPSVYRIGSLIIKTLYQSDVGLVGWADGPRLPAGLVVPPMPLLQSSQRPCPP
jgi:hypothetical protein